MATYSRTTRILVLCALVFVFVSGGNADALFLCGDSHFSNVESEGCAPINPDPIARERKVIGNTGVVPLSDAPLGLPASIGSAAPHSLPLPESLMGGGSHNAATQDSGKVEEVLKAVSDCLSGFSVEGNGAQSACNRIQNLDQLFK
jgi:hypothetical protein